MNLDEFSLAAEDIPWCQLSYDLSLSASDSGDVSKIDSNISDGANVDTKIVSFKLTTLSAASVGCVDC